VKKRKSKFPYDYKTFALKGVNGSATFIGTPSKEQMEAVNKLAQLAFEKLKKSKL
jgi:hypothetical protein